jgi:CRP-like cAMP-binding protein
VRPGEFFGEAGLHGAQRAALRAVACQDSVCVALSPDAMREWFEASPALAREIGQSLEVRRRALAALRAAPPVATAATTAAAAAGEPAPDA